MSETWRPDGMISSNLNHAIDERDFEWVFQHFGSVQLCSSCLQWSAVVKAQLQLFCQISELLLSV